MAKEELGIKVEIQKLLGYIYYPSEEKERGWGWSVGIAFQVKIKSGKPRGSWQGRKVKFFPTLPQKIILEQKRFLKENLEKK